DRWHLLKNAREALERFLDRYAGRIAEGFAEPVQPAPTQTTVLTPAPAVAPPIPEVPAPEVAPESQAATPAAPAQARPLSAKQQRRLERYQEVRRLHAAGQSLRHIARALHLSRGTVLRYARAEQCPDWRPGRPRRKGASRAAPHAERIDAWLATGNRN